MKVKDVTIPAIENHNGLYSTTVALVWTCPKCGGERGEIVKARSCDGSRILECDGWQNPCGHVDKYADCIKEAMENGLNPAR